MSKTSGWKNQPDNIEDLFKELDVREYKFFASSLGALMKALVEEGFSREEAMQLVQPYAKFVYDMSIEEFAAQKAAWLDDRIAEMDEEEGNDDEDVDPGEEIA